MTSYSARFCLTLLIGAAGGTFFYSLSLPLPWMLGAMCFCLAAAMLRLPIVSARRVRPPLAAIVGVALGSAFSSSAMAGIANWVPVSVAVVVSTLMGGAIGFVYLRIVGKFDPVSAYFAAMPGGLYEMASQAGLFGGDERRVALTHGIRVFVVVLSIPIFFRLTTSLPVGAPASLASGGGVNSVLDGVLLVGCAALGWPLATRLRIPNPCLIGPMVLSALVHSLEWTRTAPPYELLSGAQVVLGTSIGGQFIGSRGALIGRMLLHGLVPCGALIAVCVGIAWLTSAWSGVEMQVIVLALAPGGTTEMSLVALAIGAEVALVSTHQMLRVILIYVTAAPAFRLLRRSTDRLARKTSFGGMGRSAERAQEPNRSSDW